MSQWEPPMAGTLKIKNPKTLRKWESSGKLAAKARQGWIFAKKCGRFVDHICHCSSCRRGLKSSYYGTEGWFEKTKEELNELKINSQNQQL